MIPAVWAFQAGAADGPVAPRRPLPAMPIEAPRATAAGGVPVPPRVFVKLRDGADVHGAASALGAGVSARPWVRAEAVAALVARAEARSGRAQPDYGTLLSVDGSAGSAISAARSLAARDDVEVVWVRPGLVPLPAPERRRERDRGRGEAPEEDPTDSFVALQGYLHDAPGIGARWAWEQGYTGEGVRVADVEFALNRRHEELGKRVAMTPGAEPHDPFEGAGTEHGTAVMGIVVGQKDKAGIRGIAHGAEPAFYPVYDPTDGWRPDVALLAACADSKPGDIVMVELQTDFSGAYAPMEVDPAVWMATRTCTDAGVVVVAAAGNGGRDLDAAELASWRERGDSGAILVGAGTGGADGALTAESFSNYGARVDVQGWGSRVFTVGYGDHAVVEADPNRTYTAQFGGTSSATPIVAGAAALVQHAAVQQRGEPLAPEALRDLLRRTGVRQGADRRDRPIGPLPDVRAAIEGLGRRAGRREAAAVPIAEVGAAPAAPGPVASDGRGPLAALSGCCGLSSSGVTAAGLLGFGLAIVRRR